MNYIKNLLIQNLNKKTKQLEIHHERFFTMTTIVWSEVLPAPTEKKCTKNHKLEKKKKKELAWATILQKQQFFTLLTSPSSSFEFDTRTDGQISTNKSTEQKEFK